MFSRTASLRYPIGAPPRTAVLGPWFRESREVRVFASSDQLTAFAPATLAGSLDELLKAAEAGVVLSHAAIVLHRPGEALLSADDREKLWRAFHVPVFEQIVGERWRLLAAECEAHDGLHVTSPRAMHAEYSVEESPCACGLKSPRVSRKEAVERLRSAAVYAR